MADFTLQVQGLATAEWKDPAGLDGSPSRLNARIGFPHRRFMGTVGSVITVKAVVAGVVGPADGTLGGRLFTAWIVQAPVLPLSPMGGVGFSSVQSFLAAYAGHYVLGFHRASGGIEHVHMDVQ